MIKAPFILLSGAFLLRKNAHRLGNRAQCVSIIVTHFPLGVFGGVEIII
jgi:hypothetical protein